jgi:two-component system chemotaxis response regulator CheB
MDNPVTLLIVDDSRIYRAAVESAFSDEPDIRVVGSVFEGRKALEFLRSRIPDVVTLDVEMPGIDGLQTLAGIQEVNRHLPPEREIGVIMLSAYTRRGAEVTVKALQTGAFDFVTKPSGGSADENLQLLRRDLLPRVRLYLARRARKGTAKSRTSVPPVGPEIIRDASAARPSKVRNVRAILIGASTGGPKALQVLLPRLVARLDMPIVTVQHMPPEFTRSLADQLARILPVPAVEVAEGMELSARHVYIARGGQHLALAQAPGGRLLARLLDDPPECGCRPSVSVLFRSAASVLGAEALAIVLTGMGNDGAKGLVPLHQAGAYVIAQDEESSVVWGMPGAVVAAGLAHAVLPLEAIAAEVESIALRRGPP